VAKATDQDDEKCRRPRVQYRMQIWDTKRPALPACNTSMATPLPQLVKRQDGRNRTFLVPRTGKGSALTASTSYIHIRSHAPPDTFKRLLSSSSGSTRFWLHIPFESRSFRLLPLPFFPFAWRCTPSAPFIMLMGNSLVMLSIATMLISAGVTLVRAESHTIRFKNQ
jgi:hypothetical protein